MKLANEINSLKQILSMGMISETEYNNRFATIMSNYSKEYKVAQSKNYKQYA